MRRERRNFSGAEKMAILREHLIDKVPVSEVCEKHGFQPTLFYHWQKKLFEEGAVVFEQPRRKPDRQKAAEARRDRPSLAALRDWHQSDKSLGAQPRAPGVRT